MSKPESINYEERKRVSEKLRRKLIKVMKEILND